MEGRSRLRHSRTHRRSFKRASKNGSFFLKSMAWYEKCSGTVSRVIGCLTECGPTVDHRYAKGLRRTHLTAPENGILYVQPVGEGDQVRRRNTNAPQTPLSSRVPYNPSPKYLRLDPDQDIESTGQSCQISKRASSQILGLPVLCGCIRTKFVCWTGATSLLEVLLWVDRLGTKYCNLLVARLIVDSNEMLRVDVTGISIGPNTYYLLGRWRRF